MKLSEVKTRDQYWQVADVWYQRAKSMNRIWQNDNEPISRRIKAHAIFTHYARICLEMAHMRNKIKYPCNYPSGRV